MFTGIIEEVGKIEMIKPIAGGKTLVISAKKVLNDLKIGDSISVNGVCLTVTKFSSNHFCVDAVGETLNKNYNRNAQYRQYCKFRGCSAAFTKVRRTYSAGHVNDVAEISEIKSLVKIIRFR